MSDIDPFIVTQISDEPSLDWFGFDVTKARDGEATVIVTVTEEQVNGNKMAHGGLVFAVADQAFAMAANTVLHHAATVDAVIQYLAPSWLGETLAATARTTYHDDRRAVVDVDVRVGERTVALYRGTARAVKRS